MQQLNLPSYPIKLKEDAGEKYIFDAVRKKYLRLQPEEWVRQNFIQYLVQEKKYPISLIEIEKGLKYNELQKRADIVLNSTQGKPVVLVECKAPQVKISQATFEQVAVYNTVFKVPYLIVTNGLNHYCAKINFEDNSFQFLEEIPSYSELE
ncbi:MAG: type I restriction enzyme HsdR N-terminal domain-containing protein [Vicingus serpentipes]|nr:type I restriction enzyme HsdR N-terminal domain-containing protein [Vicingus serpentipes]